jgi:hypothetical protein
MGRGVALEATQRFPGIRFQLGQLIETKGNVVSYIDYWAPFSPASSKRGHHLVSFPVKHHWAEPADLQLINQSCIQLVALLDSPKFRALVKSYGTVVIPRPGCGNGKRDWEKEVKPICSQLDDRFHIITKD